MSERRGSIDISLGLGCRGVVHTGGRVKRGFVFVFFLKGKIIVYLSVDQNTGERENLMI